MHKMPLLYVADSIMKNVREGYLKAFGSRIFDTVRKAHAKMDPDNRKRLFRLVKTWSSHIPPVFTPRYVQQMIDAMVLQERTIFGQGPPVKAYEPAYRRPEVASSKNGGVDPKEARLFALLDTMQEEMGVPKAQRMTVAYCRQHNPQLYADLKSRVDHEVAASATASSATTDLTEEQSEDALIDALYESLQCPTTALRFPDTKDGRDAYDKHLDSLFRRQQRLSRLNGLRASRPWFHDGKEWIELDLDNVKEREKVYNSFFAEQAQKELEREEKKRLELEEARSRPPGVPVDESQSTCPFCGDLFNKVLWEKPGSDGLDSTWTYDKTMYSPEDGKIVHIECFNASQSTTPRKSSDVDVRDDEISTKEDEDDERGSKRPLTIATAPEEMGENRTEEDESATKKRKVVKEETIDK